MPVEQIDIEKLLELSEQMPVMDVRSPAEFSHAHIPGALPLPLFTDEQRKLIGTAYKQQSRQAAVTIGLDFFSEHLKNILAETEEQYKKWNEEKGNGDFIFRNNPIILHCWRGGMRSGAVAWLLNLYGFKVYTIKGGYKAYRRWTISQFEKEYVLHILGGNTGSGKTGFLREIKTRGARVIDLERLANHKGSAFGSIEEEIQPTQEMFENLLALNLYKENIKQNEIHTNADAYTKKLAETIWLEDESRHIGSVGIPNAFWDQMRKSKVYFLEIPFEERLNYIVSTYGSFDKEELKKSILKIQKRLGGLETKNAIHFLSENKVKECFTILLHYYDKMYTISLHKRENLEIILNKIPFESVDINNVPIFLDMLLSPH